jgi:hypothetical protein
MIKNFNAYNENIGISRYQHLKWARDRNMQFGMTSYSMKLYRLSETSSFYWTHRSRFHMKAEGESNLRNVFLNTRQDDG